MSRSLTNNAQRVLEARYLRRDETGEVIETPDALFRRVSRAIATGEETFGGEDAVSLWQETYYEAISQLDFLPNSPTLMNAGLALGQLSACFVLPVEDSIDGIFDSLKLMARIQQSGGGTGFSFSRLRPKGDTVKSTGGEASGPVSFMRIFDCATDNIRQGGRRRGANMGVLRIDHPDIEAFIDSKRDGTSFRNFNLSVGITNGFMQSLAAGREFALRHPSDGRVIKTTSATELFARITEAAWCIGDPGMVFLDTINDANPTPSLGSIEATNPCGEVPLLSYEACNLGSINLRQMTRVAGSGSTEIDWGKLRRVTRLATRFLDDVIEVNRYPDTRISEIVRGNRKIGLGVMGFADLLILLDVPYGTEESVRIASGVMKFIATEALAESRDLAATRGVFPNWHESIYARDGLKLRNATLTSIAPTGTLGIIAGTSSGIEPLFALAYTRSHVLDDETLIEVSPVFQKYAADHGFYSESLLAHLRAHGSLAGWRGVSGRIRKLFCTALEISPQEHLRIQEAFQNEVDNAVSKTINLPNAAGVDEVASIYLDAWHRNLKGITVYRYGCTGRQVLELGAKETLL